MTFYVLVHLLFWHKHLHASIYSRTNCQQQPNIST